MLKTHTGLVAGFNRIDFSTYLNILLNLEFYTSYVA